jgi:plasmid stabilization system protein ParE
MRWRALTGAFGRYLVFYRVGDDDAVNVVRVLHSARDILSILGDG